MVDAGRRQIVYALLIDVLLRHLARHGSAEPFAQDTIWKLFTPVRGRSVK